MSVWRRLRDDLTAKLPEWHAAAQERERKLDAERNAAQAAEFERMQPIINRIRDYLGDKGHWTPSEQHFTLVPEAVAAVPPELMAGSTAMVTNTLEAEFGDYGMLFSREWNDAEPCKVTIRFINQRQIEAVPSAPPAEAAVAPAASAPRLVEKDVDGYEHLFDPDTGYCTCLGSKAFHNRRGQVTVYDDDGAQIEYWSDIEDYEAHEEAKDH